MIPLWFLLFPILFFLGLAIGSFLNVVIMRSERGEALTGRSHCDSCGETLSWRELIPVISFLYQKGRCRHCGAVLSVQYPLVELGTGVGFVIVGNTTLYEGLIRGNSVLLLTTVFFCVAFAAAIVIIVADARYQIIPNGAVLALLIEGTAATIIRNGLACISGLRCVPHSLSGAGWDVAASMGSVTFLFCLWYFSRGRAMGFGDVKLIGATALLLGYPLSVVGLVFAFWLGGLWGLLLIAARIQDMQSRIAFGPFIIAGAACAYFFGGVFLIASGFRYLLWK